MKNLTNAEMQEVNGGGWIADFVEDLLCWMETADVQFPTGPKI